MADADTFLICWCSLQTVRIVPRTPCCIDPQVSFSIDPLNAGSNRSENYFGNVDIKCNFQDGANAKGRRNNLL